MIDGSEINLVNTHLTHLDDADAGRRAQVDAILDGLNAAATGLLIVGGDMNAEADDPALVRLAEGAAQPLARVAMNRPTLASQDRCVDHLFVGPGVETLTAARFADVTDADGRLPSDHHGVVAWLRMT